MSVKIAYGVAEAAALCNVTESTMRNLIRAGEIHAVKMGDLRIGHVELERYLLGIPRSEITVATVANFVATPPKPARSLAPCSTVLRGGNDGK